MTVQAMPVTGALRTIDIDQLTSSKLKESARKAKAIVKRLQMRITRAYEEGKHGKAKALQWLLTHSHSAKILAVIRVITNRGGKTPGIDGEIWQLKDLNHRILQLTRRGYKASPLRRVYIPKSGGRKRPLGIPTMKDRAMQSLYLMALEPIAEMQMTENTYGFRPYRATADAMEQCFNCLSRRHSSRWILEGDIKGCFDHISHEWLIKHIPMDKVILSTWLSAGIIEGGLYSDTKEGTPQGGIISPVLANLALNGIERVVQNTTKISDKAHAIIYADDFVVTARNPEILSDKIRPAIEEFIKERGLTLCKEKTNITSIDKGFDFLGFTLRKYKNKLITKPSKKAVRQFLSNIREVVESNRSIKAECLIGLLNPMITGWCNYYRHVCSKKTFSKIDHSIFQILYKWALKRHLNKGRRWVVRKYFKEHENSKWLFHARTQTKGGVKSIFRLNLASDTAIIRHRKIIGHANPYRKSDQEYFVNRVKHKQAQKRRLAESRALKRSLQSA